MTQKILEEYPELSDLINNTMIGPYIENDPSLLQPLIDIRKNPTNAEFVKKTMSKFYMDLSQELGKDFDRNKICDEKTFTKILSAAIMEHIANKILDTELESSDTKTYADILLEKIDNSEFTASFESELYKTIQ